MVFDTNCVSGKISTDHGTHTGVYPIAYKQTDATLRGDNYESHVNYWMPFNMGEGLHDATWRSKFGGTIYRNGGSHGCVNLPLSSAKTIYGIVEAGWPVIVFYTGNTEQENLEYANPQAKCQELIAEIETVTLESEPKIAEARTLFDSLTAEQQVQVLNYPDLLNAEVQLNLLKQGIAPAEQPAPATDLPQE